MPEPGTMLPVADAAKALDGLGFERIETIHGSTYKDNSTVIVVPTRGTIDWRVVQRWQNLIAPMNQKRMFMFAVGHEVGKAYDALIEQIIAHPDLSKWKYILTLEDDNLPPPDAHIRLLESIEEFKFDAVGGIYFTKGDFNMPMAYGDPDEYRRTGVLDFKPRDIRQALQRGTIMETNGCAMGVTLWRMDLFKRFPKPWFVTCNDYIEGQGTKCFTQDLYFCEVMKKNGCRIGIDLRVRTGHLDINSGVVF